MKGEKRDAFVRDATGNLFRHNGQDVQTLFVGTRVVVNFRVARHSPRIRNHPIRILSAIAAIYMKYRHKRIEFLS
jgi:hypothetical protein